MNVKAGHSHDVVRRVSDSGHLLHQVYSVIIPVYNAVNWLDECLEAVYNQDFEGKFEVSIYNDSSTDSSLDLIRKWEKQFAEKSIDVVIGGHTSESPRGVGYAKNQAVQQSRGTYLSFLDADDVMHASRIRKQYQAALAHPGAIIGSNFHRLPTGSTDRYTRWANTLTNQQLYTQIYTSHGPSLIMPTWFCHRQLFEKIQGFDEGGKGVPEDLIFFFRHLELGGDLYRVEEDLLMYRYHTEATSFSIHQDTIWNIRMKYIQKNVIDSWQTFTIWNAGKQGKKFYKSLTPENQKKVRAFCDVDLKKIKRGFYEYHESKVRAFCDVDLKKIKRGFYEYHESKEKPKPRVPIVSYNEAEGPFIICVKLDLTEGALENHIKSLNLTEGKDYYHFS